MVPDEGERMAHGLLIRLHHERGVPVLVVAGELDFSSADEVRLQGRELVEAALAPPSPVAPGPSQASQPSEHLDDDAQRVPVVVLDASGIGFVDSAGLGALVTLLKRALALRAGFSIAGAGQALRTRLATTGLDMVVALHASVEEAVGAAVGAVGGEPGRTGLPQERPPIGGRHPGDRTGSG